jgi:hypothetical protein
MKISLNVKETPYEKMDCKITHNGLLWLRSGKFTSRFDGKERLQPLNKKKQANQFDKQYNDMAKKMQNEPLYFARNHFELIQRRSIQEAKKVPKQKLYSINKRSVRARLTNFLNTTKGEKMLYFYTITFPKSINYNSAYKILNSTLTSIRRQINDYNYLWIAERQKNGTIHFHLASFKHIKIRVINELVKKSIKNEIRIGNIDWSIHNANRYNGVDISKDRDTGIQINFATKKRSTAISKYLTKYISKSKEKFPRKAWSCSYDVSIVATSIRVCTSEAVAIFDEMIDWNNCLFSNEFCEFYPWIKEAPEIIDSILKKENDVRLKSVL